MTQIAECKGFTAQDMGQAFGVPGESLEEVFGKVLAGGDEVEWIEWMLDWFDHKKPPSMDGERRANSEP